MLFIEYNLPEELMDILAEYGYAGLFIASFLAATVLPVSSEVVLVFLLANNYDPVISVSLATAGNVLGSCVNYAIGLWGSVFIIRKVLRISQNAFEQAQQRFTKYGVLSLLFAWVPIIGDPLTVAAGALKIHIALFLMLVTAGKLIRYIVVASAV
jgi:membrane protein YqaA with SNARE-associated domain